MFIIRKTCTTTEPVLYRFSTSIEPVQPGVHLRNPNSISHCVEKYIPMMWGTLISGVLSINVTVPEDRTVSISTLESCY